MLKYEDVLKDTYINEIFSKIENLENKNIEDKNKQFWWIHGKPHVFAVVSYMEQIMTYVGLSDEEINLGKITGLLHDIGCIEYKEGHSVRSAQMTKNYLNGKDVSENDIEIICNAILDHGRGENISSKIGAALVIADKINVDKSRILEEGKIQEGSRQYVYIDDVELIFENNILIVNFKVKGEIILKEFKEYYFTIKIFEIVEKACKYLGLASEIKMNGKKFEI